MKNNIKKLRKEIFKLDMLLDSIIDTEKIEEFCEIVENLKDITCDIDEHEWIMDQCGMWQHQYCIHCTKVKYPGLPSTCRELRETMGNMSEEEYIKKS